MVKTNAESNIEMEDQTKERSASKRPKNSNRTGTAGPAWTSKSVTHIQFRLPAPARRPEARETRETHTDLALPTCSDTDVHDTSDYELDPTFF